MSRKDMQNTDDAVDTWKQAERALRLLHPKVLNARSPHFVDYAWNHFLFPVVIAQLTTGSYQGQRSVLLAGLLAWILRSDSPDAIRNAIALQAMTIMTAAEERAADAAISRNIYFREIASRLAFPGPDFMEEIYYAIGGLRTARSTSSPEDQRAELTSKTVGVRTTAAILGLLHFHADKLLDMRAKASLEGAAFAYKALLKKAGSTRHEEKLRDETNDHAPSAAMISAASTISHGDGTLLDAILFSPLDQELLSTHWDELLGKCAFVAGSVLSVMHKGKLTKAHDGIVYTVEPIPFSPPPYADDDASIIRRAFDSRSKERRARSPRPQRKSG